MVDPSLKQGIVCADMRIVLPSEIGEVDAIYVAVPTPPKLDGSVDTSILESVFYDLAKYGHLGTDDKTVVIAKSTATGEFYDSMAKQYRNLVHVPEFLRQNDARADYRSPPVKVIGGLHLPSIIHAIETIEGKYAMVEFTNWVITDPRTAATYKYLANSYLATKVTFMNDFYEYAKRQEIDWIALRTCMGKDTRIGDGHTQVPGPDGTFGWAGACFPKDIDALIADAEQFATDLKLLKSVRKINNFHRSKP